MAGGGQSGYGGQTGPGNDGIYLRQIKYENQNVWEWLGASWNWVGIRGSVSVPPETPPYIAMEGPPPPPGQEVEAPTTEFGGATWEWLDAESNAFPGAKTWVSRLDEEPEPAAEDNETDADLSTYQGNSIAKRFAGNILDTIKHDNWVAKMLGWLFGFTTRFNWNDGYDVRGNGSTYYIIKKDFGLFSRVWIKKGSWLKIKLFKRKHYVPSKDIKIACVGCLMWIYKCVSGGIEEEITKEVSLFPILDVDPSSADMIGWYGSLYQKDKVKNVTLSRIKNFLKENGYKRDSVSVKASFDIDEYNSYAICTAEKKKGKRKRAIVLSFETPFDDEYRCTYRDATAMEILRDLSVVSNRWLYVDVDNKIWMLPRSQTIETVDIMRRNVLKLERKHHKETETDINVNRYEEDDEGRVSNYGIRLRKNELEAIRKFYREKFQGERIETTVKILMEAYFGNAPANLGLMKELKILSGVDATPESYGVVIEQKKSFLEAVMEITAEMYNV